MKKIFYFCLMASVSISLASCQKEEHATHQKITYYPQVELVGDYAVVPVGGTYVDPGFSATLKGEDVTDQVQVTNNIDNTKIGIYSVSYLLTNEDGFSAGGSRDVYVVNPKTSFENLYLSSVSYGTRHYEGLPVIIKKKSGDTYVISDLLGGYYCYGRYPGYDAYGYDFFVDSDIKLNSDNSITLVKEGDWYFYDSSDPIVLASGKYDPATGTVNMSLSFSSSTTTLFTVSMSVAE